MPLGMLTNTGNPVSSTSPSLRMQPPSAERLGGGWGPPLGMRGAREAKGAAWFTGGERPNVSFCGNPACLRRLGTGFALAVVCMGFAAGICE